MKPPADARAGSALVVHGPTRLLPFRELSIGGFKVASVDWDPSTTARESRLGPQFPVLGVLLGDSVHYQNFRFDVKSSQRALHGECTKRWADGEHDGQPDSVVTTLNCRCTQGGATQLDLELTDGSMLDDGRTERGTGKLVVSDGPEYELRGVVEYQNGMTSGDLLGYHVRSPEGEGAIELRAKGRAWLPTSTSEGEQASLVCGYAAVYLYANER